MFKRLAILCMFALALAACEREEPATPEKSVGAQESNIPGTTAKENEPGAVGGVQEERQTGEPTLQEKQEGTALVQPKEQEPVVGQEPGATQEPAVAAGQQEKPAQDQEFTGQSPEFGNAPETIILQAKNGNVTFPHKAHADMMECKTCHLDAKPGKMSGFSKDQAHALCQGCHKEKGAGPTKCNECHKKS